MKKAYIIPASEVVCLHTENCLALSMKLSEKEGTEQLSNKSSGWNSAHWNSADWNTEED